uniref:Uncharacterized protein n=1 Tax=Apteryx owenii TaxID=8824 RepID=A0A8B9QC98_APTOW
MELGGRTMFPFPTMKVLFVGLAVVLCIGVVEALQCKVCKYKFPLIGCFHGANETTCERRERCAIIKTFLGTYGSKLGVLFCLGLVPLCIYLFWKTKCISRTNEEAMMRW